MKLILLFESTYFKQVHGFCISICQTILSWLMVITLQVETLITAITSTMDESKKVERELVAIQERQVGEDDTNSAVDVSRFLMSLSWSHWPENTLWQIASSAERKS